VAGSGTIEPRVTPVPVRLPLPPARNQGSIYAKQTAARRSFTLTTETERALRT
jgi:phytanoyl-CoA hydroxylase